MASEIAPIVVHPHCPMVFLFTNAKNFSIELFG